MRRAHLLLSSSFSSWSSKFHSTLSFNCQLMASEDQTQNESSPPPSPPPPMNFKEKVEDQYKKIREHAETYPYVWASYIFVYGGLALWTTYRFTKLRRTENRVRILQERLRRIHEAEEATAANASSSTKPPSIVDKPH